MNEWEKAVLETEMRRPGLVAWYRNPSRSSQDSLGVAYIDNAQVRIVRPDFTIFSRMADGSIAADIVDPRGTQFSDAIPKLRGLSSYAEKHSETFRRIEAVAKIGDEMRVLDLTLPDVRKAAMDAPDAKSLYESDLAANY